MSPATGEVLPSVLARSPSVKSWPIQRVRLNSSMFLFITTWKQEALPCSATMVDQARKNVQMRYQRSPYAAVTAARLLTQFSCQR